MHGLAAIRNLAPYQTTKFALVGLTESLRADLRRTNVGATALCPGFVLTKFMDSVENANPRRPLQAPKRWMCVTPQRVARAGVRGIRSNRGLVLVGWPARVLWGTWRLSPWLYDWLRKFL
jgi:short-subunit dehydrogenase